MAEKKATAAHDGESEFGFSRKRRFNSNLPSSDREQGANPLAGHRGQQYEIDNEPEDSDEVLWKGHAHSNAKSETKDWQATGAGCMDSPAHTGWEAEMLTSDFNKRLTLAEREGHGHTREEEDWGLYQGDEEDRRPSTHPSEEEDQEDSFDEGGPREEPAGTNADETGLDQATGGQPQKGLTPKYPNIRGSKPRSGSTRFDGDATGLKKRNRETLIARYYAALAEREVILKENQAIQNRIALHFRNKKVEEKADPHNKNMFDQEQRYIRLMAEMERLLQQYEDDKVGYKLQAETTKQLSEDIEIQVDTEERAFMEKKRQVALSSMHVSTSKFLAASVVEQRIEGDIQKDDEVTTLRLENIKLKFRKAKLEHVLKAKDELAKGLHLIDFEQLKLENQSLNEKIEERNEELRKLRLKISSTVQILTHLKEKMQFLTAKNSIQFAKLQEVEVRVSKKRDTLTMTKKARDGLRIDNQKLRKKSGLLCFEPLLRNYEELKDMYIRYKHELVELETKHTALILNTKKLRKKITRAKAELKLENSS